MAIIGNLDRAKQEGELSRARNASRAIENAVAGAERAAQS